MKKEKRRQLNIEGNIEKNLSAQKKRRLREKDAARKRLKRDKEKVKSTPTVLEEVQNAIQKGISTPLSSSAVKKAVYRAKKQLPKSPKKFAQVMCTLVENGSPKRRQALRMKGVSNPKDKQNLDDLIEVIKDVDGDLRGRNKTTRKKRKSLARHIKMKYGMVTSFCKAVGMQRKFLSKLCMKKQETRKDCLDEAMKKSI